MNNGKINALNVGRREAKVCPVLFFRLPALREGIWCFQIGLNKKCVVAAAVPHSAFTCPRQKDFNFQAIMRKRNSELNNIPVKQSK